MQVWDATVSAFSRAQQACESLCQSFEDLAAFPELSLYLRDGAEASGRGKRRSKKVLQRLHKGCGNGIRANGR